jgi:hypothetical protein
VSREVEGPTVKEGVESDGRSTGRLSDRREGRGGRRQDTWRNHAGVRGENKMNGEGEGDREGSDVSNPRGPRFAREVKKRIGGENERKSLTGCEGMEVDMRTVRAQERIEEGEVSEKMGVQDGTRKKSLSLVTWGKWAMGSTTVHIWKVGMGGRVVVVGG